MINIEGILKQKIPVSVAISDSGVYLLIRGDEVVYVGSSKNVTARIVVHKRDKDFDGFFVIPCAEAELPDLESEYIAQFTPTYNKAIPNCNKFKYVGQMKGTENRKITIEAVVIGGKIYVDSSFPEITFNLF